MSIPPDHLGTSMVNRRSNSQEDEFLPHGSLFLVLAISKGEAHHRTNRNWEQPPKIAGIIDNGDQEASRVVRNVDRTCWGKSLTID